MTNPDFRSLCSQLVQLVEQCPPTADTDWIVKRMGLLYKARTALAQPAPKPTFTDDEVAMLARWLRAHAATWKQIDHNAGLEHSPLAERLTRAADLLEQFAARSDATQPNPHGYAYRYPDPFGGTVLKFNNGQEVNGGKPIEAIPYWLGATPLRSVLNQRTADYNRGREDGTAPVPVPVSERLPSSQNVRPLWKVMEDATGTVAEWGPILRAVAREIHCRRDLDSRGKVLVWLRTEADRAEMGG